MNHKELYREEIDLWPDGAPGALGDAKEDCPTITLFLVENEKPRGFVIVCPGGGYVVKAPHEGEPIALWLNTLGISAVVLEYRVSPYRHPVPLMDAQRAIRLVRFHAKEWNIDPNHIGILGFSAGGHLAATAGTHYDTGNPEAKDQVDRIGCRPDALILCYPVITVNEFGHQGSMINLLGEHPSEELLNNLSNEKQVDENTPVAFLWHTADDEGVPVENSLLFAAALRHHHVPFALHVYSKGPHGLGLAEEYPEICTWTLTCGEWLKKNGF